MNRDWISANVGARLLQTSTTIFARYAREGRFATQSLPGLPTRYSRADVEAFRDSTIKPPKRVEAVAS